MLEAPFDRICDLLCQKTPRVRITELRALEQNSQFPKKVLAELRNYFRVGHDRRDIVGLLGQSNGRYRLLDVLGSGGSSIVYLAESIDGAHQYALKLLHPDAPAEVRAFLQAEAEKLEAVRCPGVVALVDHGEWPSADGSVRPFLVTEVVHGLAIDRYAARRRLGLSARVELLLGACDTLSRIYLQQALVHLDLKPENLLVGHLDGQLRVLDFGIARHVDRTQVDPPAGRALTPSYASPEQLDPLCFGAPGTHSDQYSLALVLLTLLGGQRWATEQRTADPYAVPRRPAHAELSSGLWSVIERALQARPDRRHPDLTTFAAELRLELSRLPRLQKRRQATRIGVGVVLCASVLAASEHLSRPARASALNTLGRAAQAAQRRAAALHAFERAGELDPENEIVAYNIGTAAEDVGDLPRASLAYERARETARDPIPALNNLGRALLLGGQPEMALSRLREGLIALGEVGDSAPAEELLRAYRLHKNFGWAALELARSRPLTRAAALLEAERHLRKAVVYNERLRALDIARGAHASEALSDAAAYCLLAEVLTEHRDGGRKPELAQWWQRCSATPAHGDRASEGWKQAAASFVQSSR